MEKQEIVNIIYRAITDVSPYAAELLSQTAKLQDLRLVDLGVNSIDYAEIAHLVMDQLGIDYPLDMFTCTNRVDELADMFYEMTVAAA